MKNILIVKTSSLGDVVHNFPVLADIRGRFPHAQLDWVVEESYAPLVRLHPGVRRAIPVAIRRWRRNFLGPSTWREIREWRRQFGAESYDAVIDTQGLFKSGLLVSAATGRRHGYDAASAREPIAARFYDTVHHVPRNQHAVARNRELVAASLGYRARGAPDYGLAAAREDAAPGRNVVFLHSTSRADKHWPEENWIGLGRRLENEGMHIVLPWGGPAERERSERIARCLERGKVPSALALDAMATMLAGAHAVVGVDTGLVHLAAALGRRVAAIYCATDPRLTGTYGAERAVNLGGPGHAPSQQQVIDTLRSLGAI